MVHLATPERRAQLDALPFKIEQVGAKLIFHPVLPTGSRITAEQGRICGFWPGWGYGGAVHGNFESWASAGDGWVKE